MMHVVLIGGVLPALGDFGGVEGQQIDDIVDDAGPLLALGLLTVVSEDLPLGGDYLPIADPVGIVSGHFLNIGQRLSVGADFEVDSVQAISNHLHSHALTVSTRYFANGTYELPA